MKRDGFQYLIRLQYLGFRYSGWQIQPNQRTVEGMLVKTLQFMFPDRYFKLLGAGRTDAKVSALDAACELFVEEELGDIENLLWLFNKNLPPDIKVCSIQPKRADVNLIKDSKLKEYVYLFSSGQKNHPYSAAFMGNYMETLDIELMKTGAKLYEGTHDFSVYTAQLKPDSKSVRTIFSCYIEENKLLTANFFPDLTYAFRVSAKGFMRYQIRMMMGALVQLGKNELSLQELERSLQPNGSLKLTTIAPGSGLHLNTLEF